MKAVRRLIAITLLLLFGAVLAAPLLAQGNVDDSQLAACCRRNGAHHCSMGAMPDSPDPHLRAFMAKCPYCPASVSADYSTPLAAPTAAAIFAGLVSHPAATAQTESLWRIARDRSRQKRGPPTDLLA